MRVEPSDINGPRLLGCSTLNGCLCACVITFPPTISRAVRPQIVLILQDDRRSKFLKNERPESKII
jgi:hypothetical protein